METEDSKQRLDLSKTVKARSFDDMVVCLIVCLCYLLVQASLRQTVFIAEDGVRRLQSQGSQIRSKQWKLQGPKLHVSTGRVSRFVGLGDPIV